VQRAVTTKKPSIEAATGPAQDGLKQALANAATPAVAPVFVRGMPIAVVAVGDPLGDPATTGLADLGKLADLLGRTYERILGGR
jgi:hypothetical protein